MLGHRYETRLCHWCKNDHYKQKKGRDLCENLSWINKITNSHKERENIKKTHTHKTEGKGGTRVYCGVFLGVKIQSSLQSGYSVSFITKLLWKEFNTSVNPFISYLLEFYCLLCSTHLIGICNSWYSFHFDNIGWAFQNEEEK